MKLAQVTKIVNLTPHDVHVWVNHFESVTIPVSGTVARVNVTRTPSQELRADPVPADALDGIRISVSEVGRLCFVNMVGADVTRYWYPEDNTLYVVSGLVRTYYDRPYFVSPGDPIRDDAGRVTGCRGLDRGKWVGSMGDGGTETQASRLAAIKTLCDSDGGDYYWAPAPSQPEVDRLMRDWIREAAQELVAASTGTGYRLQMIGQALEAVAEEFMHETIGGKP